MAKVTVASVPALQLPVAVVMDTVPAVSLPVRFTVGEVKVQVAAAPAATVVVPDLLPLTMWPLTVTLPPMVICMPEVSAVKSGVAVEFCIWKAVAESAEFLCKVAPVELTLKTVAGVLVLMSNRSDDWPEAPWIIATTLPDDADWILKFPVWVDVPFWIALAAEAVQPALVQTAVPLMR